MYRIQVIRLLLLFYLFTFEDNLLAQQIRFVDYTCNGCTRLIPPKKKSDLESMIAQEYNLDSASEKVKSFFRPNLGDKFMLFCQNCKGCRTIIYPSLQGFPKRPNTTLGYFASKGDNKVYKLEQAVKLLADSIAVFDKFKIDFSDMAYRDDNVLGLCKVSYSYKDKLVVMPVSYNQKSKIMTFSADDIFGRGIDKSILDTTKISFIYPGVKGLVSYRMQLNFLTDEEKNQLKDIAAYYKSIFPDWTAKQVAKELTEVIQYKYSKVAEDDVADWLNTIQKSKK